MGTSVSPGGTGTQPLTVVPAPGALVTVTVPPTAPRRSAMPDQAGAGPGPVAGDEAGPVVDHREPQLAVDQRQLDVDQGLRRVLGGVLQGLEAGEVDGSLDGSPAGAGPRPRAATRTRTSSRPTRARARSAGPARRR